MVVITVSFLLFLPPGDTVVYQAVLSPEGSSPIADVVDDVVSSDAVAVPAAESVTATPQPGDDIVYVPPVATATPPPVEAVEEDAVTQEA